MITRRTFIQTAAAGTSAALLAPGAAHGHALPRTRPWYKHAYRRNVIDMHIMDWDPEFLSKFDPDMYVERLRTARAQSAVLYAHSHVGLCYFPTKIGQTHAAFAGKDHLARTVVGLRKNGIAVVLYMSLIHDTWAYRNHQDWRIRRADGAGAADGSRYGICCPNAMAYRDYIAGLAEEVCAQYEFDGVRFDMTFWPRVCYCVHCAKRFADEVGGELPTTVDWEGPTWIAFQRRREQWLVEFAKHMTQTVKNKKPDATVEHQASTFLANWRLGVSEPLAAQNDFLQGDFYGDALQGSVIRKLLYNLSPNLPYGFETSVMLNLQNHTALKPEPLLHAKAAASIADGGAFIFIDAIDPVGTINPGTYETMGRVFEDTIPYEPHAGGELVQEAAVYLSTESKFDFAQNGINVEDYSREGVPHLDALIGACRALRAHHVPYGVITKKDLTKLKRHKVLILPNVLMMDEEEIMVVRTWVEAGGSVYASRDTSLVTKDGERHADFLLGDIFGVTNTGVTAERVTYVAPNGTEAFAPYTDHSPLMLPATQRTLIARDGALVLGTLTLPYTNPDDGEKYASIHSNPPGVATVRPSVVLNRFGKGMVIYAAEALELHEHCAEIFVRLLRTLCPQFAVEAEAPACVELTLFHQADRGRFVLSAINFQKELPNIPVEGIQVSIDLQGSEITRVVELPGITEIPHRKNGERVHVALPKIRTLCMVAFEYA